MPLLRKIVGNWFPLCWMGATFTTIGVYQTRFSNLEANVAAIQAIQPDVIVSKVLSDEKQQREFQADVKESFKSLDAEIGAVGTDVAWIKGRIDRDDLNLAGRNGGK